MDKKLIVISIDSFVTEDIELLKTLPNFGELIMDSSIVERNLSTYPTLTHSIHTSIMTGCNPDRHGVIANERFLPGVRKPEWYDDVTDVKVPTLVDECVKAGYTAAYVYWPLTTNVKNALMLHRAGIHEKDDNVHEMTERMSTPGLYAEVKEHCAPAWELPHYYDWDEFAFRGVERMIRDHQSDIIYTHITVIDHERHVHGVFNPVLEESYKFIDQGLGRIMTALKETGLYDKTIINITSDHGQIDVKKVVAPNILFQQHGLQTVNENGEVTGWDAYCQGCSLSAHIYIKDHNPEILAKTRALLEENKELLGIESIFTRAEAKEKFHLDGPFDLVLETDGVTSFWSRFNGPMVQTTDNSDYMGSKATHGHLPHKGVQPAFILHNPFSKKRVLIPNGRVIDQAPTLAALLGCTMPEADGTPIKELLD